MRVSDDLREWVAEGLIDSEVADAIAAYEAEKEPSGRVGRGTEAVAYLGAVLVLIAAGIMLVEYWDRIEVWGRLVLGATITVALLVVGMILGRSEEPAVNRAQSFSWLLSVASVALTVSVITNDLVELDNQDTFLWISLTSFAAATGLWWVRHSNLQMVAMGITANASVIAIVSRAAGAPDWAFGLSFAALGSVWLLLTWGGILRPTRTSYALSGIGLLLIAFPETTDMPWPLLGLAASLVLMTLSVRLKENVLLGLGVAGLFVYIPMTIFELFGESLGVPVALLITGLVLLAVVVISVRIRRETKG